MCLVKQQGKMLLVVDAVSGWLEASPLRENIRIIKVYLGQVFARFRITKTLVSDNGPEFVSGDLKRWCESMRIKIWNHPYIIQQLKEQTRL